MHNLSHNFQSTQSISEPDLIIIRHVVLKIELATNVNKTVFSEFCTQ